VLCVLSAALSAGTATQAYDITEYFSVSGVLAGAVQCQVILNEGQAGNECDGALPFQPEFSLRPWASGGLFVKLGFAWGNGLNDDSPFVLQPWAADLQEAVEDVNGHWAYLLNAWYLHRFRFREDIELTLGVIDASDYLNHDAYGSNEYTQFMNQGLINNDKTFVPSYNPGGAAVLELGHWSVTAVAMWSDEFQGGEPFGFFGGQLSYRFESSLG
jgi:porin